MNSLYTALTAHIDSKVREERLVVFVDPNGFFLPFVEKLKRQIFAGEKKYKLVSFSGSFLESLLELHPLMQGTKKPECLVYLPYLNSNTLLHSPFLEVIKSAVSIPSDLPELLRKIAPGYFTPETLKDALSTTPPSYAELERKFLSETDVDLEVLLEKEAVLEFARRLLSGKPTFLDGKKDLPANTLEEISLAFEKTFGFSESFLPPIFASTEMAERKENRDPTYFRLPLALYLLSAEYVLDLYNCTPTDGFLLSLLETASLYSEPISDVLQNLRKFEALSYRKLATNLEDLGIFLEEKEKRTSKELGLVDTFSFEDEIHQREALRLIKIKNFTDALTKHRQRENSFWKKNDSRIAEFWDWIQLSARFGEGIAPTLAEAKQTRTLEEILRLYSTRLYEIDELQRTFILETTKITQSGDFTSYRDIGEIKTLLLNLYVEWLDGVNQHYQKICEEKGFLPAENYRQRYFYENYLSRSLDKGKVAVFFVDALRYELGVNLQKKFLESGYSSEIQPMYAELPTITSVGMNALVPSHRRGELHPVIRTEGKSILGFRSGNKQILTIEDRKSVLEEYSRQSIEWISLDDMYNDFPKQKKLCISKDLIVVHSLEIDEAGENGFLNKGYDFFESTISRIQITTDRLSDLGYTDFYIVSDHGFIQLPANSDHLKSSLASPPAFLGQRRYVLHSESMVGSQFSCIHLNSLHYAVNGDQYLCFLREPKVFRNTNSRNGFFHGGNSLQERVIPVIHAKLKGKGSLQSLREAYKIEAELTLGESVHTITLRLEPKTDSSLFQGEKKLFFELKNPALGEIRITKTSARKNSNNEIQISPNIEVSVEFEVVSISPIVVQKDSALLQIFSPLDADGIEEWLSQKPLPIPVPTLGNADLLLSSIPENMDANVRRVLRELVSVQGQFLTESTVVRMFDPPRIGAMVVRQISIFLAERGNELNFLVKIETGAEGKIFKLERKHG